MFFLWFVVGTQLAGIVPFEFNQRRRRRFFYMNFWIISLFKTFACSQSKCFRRFTHTDTKAKAVSCAGMHRVWLCCAVAFCLLLGLGYLGVVADSCVLRWWCQWNDPEPNAERGRTFAFCCCSTLWQTSCFAWICVIDRFCGSDERCIAGKSLVPVWGMRYYSGRGAREDSFFNSLFWPDLSGDLQKLILSPVKMHSGHFTDQDAPWKNCWSLILRTSRFASEQLLWWIWRRNVLLLLLLWV